MAENYVKCTERVRIVLYDECKIGFGLETLSANG